MRRQHGRIVCHLSVFSIRAANHLEILVRVVLNVIVSSLVFAIKVVCGDLVYNVNQAETSFFLNIGPK